MEKSDIAVKLKYIKLLLDMKIQNPKYMHFKPFLTVFLQTLKSKRLRNLKNYDTVQYSSCWVFQSIFAVATSAGRNYEICVDLQ